VSYATFARRAPVVSASQRKAAASVASGGLRIGEPNDDCEQEADRVADEVLAGGTLRHQWSLSGLSVNPTLRRKCSCGSHGTGGGCAECKNKEEENTLRRKASGPGDLTVVPPIVHEVLNSPGQPLDNGASSFFTRAYGHDFSQVRIHSDNEASESAKSVMALAYTVGKHVVFDAGQYALGCESGRHLLAHELTHVVQQNSTPVLRRQPASGSSGKIGPLAQKFIRGEATPEEKEILRKQLLAGQLSPEEVEALKQYLGQVIAVNIGGPVRNVHKFFKAKLKLRLSGATKTLVGGLEGTLETVAEVKGDADRKKVTVYISAPPGDTMLAELVRAKAFPRGELTFELGENYLKALNMISLLGEITVILTGKKDTKSSGLVMTSPDIPEDVELEATLSESAEKPDLAPATGAPARPPLRAFVTGGVISDPKRTGAVTTLGFDFPVGNDTKNPLAYAGFGIRGGADTRGGLRAGGAAFVGLNLNPIVLQLAFEAGIARLPAGQTEAGSGAKAAGYSGLEASAGFRVSKHVEVMALASILGSLRDKDLPSAGSVQVGAAYTF